MSFVLEIPNSLVSGKVDLPKSKSLENRYLIINALAGLDVPDSQKGEAEDTTVLKKLLKSETNELDVGDAGTVMRFMTAFCSIQKGEFILDGSQRMRQRPIGILVDALKSQGINITYLEDEGYPPLKIVGGSLKGGEIKLRADVSSQYISALMMIAPLAGEDVRLVLEGKILSSPYIHMTAELMKKSGINVNVAGNLISIGKREYDSALDLEMESDWSSAAFFYSFFACSELSELFLAGLSINSVQGDVATIDLFAKLNVKTTESNHGVLITKVKGDLPEEIYWDFKETPDLVQVFSVCCAVLGVTLKMEGLDNLSIKETDRLSALKFNVENMGIRFNYTSDTAELHSSNVIYPKGEFRSFGDHRMIMSVASVLPKLVTLTIDDISDVKKSFPGYFEQLKSFGVTVTEKP